MTFRLVCLVLSLVSFGLATFFDRAPFWQRLIGLGLTALVASMILWR